jgi:hypothetical protein
VKVSDFGIGRAVGQKGKSAPVDPRSDVLALGWILYELVTGKAREAAGPASAVRKDAPPALDPIIERATAAQATDRHPTAQALQLELERLLARSQETVLPSHLAIWIRDLFAKKSDFEDVLTEITPADGSR